VDKLFRFAVFFVSTRAKAMGIVKEGRGLRCLEVENRERERERERERT